MYEASNLRDVQALCNEIMNSPYFRKQTPAELKQLREMLNKVSLLVHESVPPLIAEIKQLLLDSYYGRAYSESYERDREGETPILRLQQRISGQPSCAGVAVAALALIEKVRL